MDTLSLTKEARIHNGLKTISFTSGLPVFPAALVKEIVFNPLCILAFFVKDKLSIGAWIYLWAFGEGSGTPLQYSCLENPMYGEAW